MKNTIVLFLLAMTTFMFFGCNSSKSEKVSEETTEVDTFKYQIDRFADLKIMRYQVPGFESLSLEQKELLYYLTQAALWGDEITWDQHYKHNLYIKRTLEAIVNSYSGDKTSDDWKEFMVYTKRVWFAKGIHHHYSSDKFMPGFTEAYFEELVNNSDESLFPLQEGETTMNLLEKLKPILFDPNVDSKNVNLNADVDMIVNSANNFYEGVTQAEVEAFYDKMKDTNDLTPISYGLNSKVVKENDQIVEKVYSENGMYGAAIKNIIYWLEKAIEVAENDKQKETISLLVSYYKTGDLKTFDAFNISWVQDLDSRIDFVNGFTETYGDPMDMKATWESIINFKNIEATKRTEIISNNAGWFEKNSPVDDKYKKEDVKGVTAKVITAVQLAGDCYPSTPIGVNLPNANWIRKEYGSKSVTIDNITYSYDMAGTGDGSLEEFAYSQEEIDFAKKYGYIASSIHTDLHECLGHGSGQLAPGTSSDALKNYGSALEEARADLFALYYIMDPKMVELGLLPSLDAAKAEYNGYIRNGLMGQLKRVELGKNIEQAHMRNRQLIAKWVYEKGAADKVIEMIKKDGKTYVVVNDHEKLRELFGELLKEIQRIKSEGDYEAGKLLVETYGVKVDMELHKEVLERYAKLNLAAFGGFVNPVLTPVYDGDKIIDIKIEYPDNYVKQMLDYAKKYSSLPVYN